MEGFDGSGIFSPFEDWCEEQGGDSQTICTRFDNHAKHVRGQGTWVLNISQLFEALAGCLCATFLVAKIDASKFAVNSDGISSSHLSHLMALKTWLASGSASLSSACFSACFSYFPVIPFWLFFFCLTRWSGRTRRAPVAIWGSFARGVENGRESAPVPGAIFFFPPALFCISGSAWFRFSPRLTWERNTSCDQRRQTLTRVS